MKRLPRPRRSAAVVLAIGASALFAVRWVSGADADAAAADRPATAARVPSDGLAVERSNRPARPAAAAVLGLQLARLDAADAAIGLPSRGPGPFEPLALAVRPVARAVAEPPAAAPPPVVPDFPYVYIGGITEDRVRTAYFSLGDRVILVRAGDTVDATYRVESLTEHEMRLVFLPLAAPLTMAFGTPR